MALHGGKLLTKANPVDESSTAAEYLSMNPESSDLHFAGPSSTAPSGIHPPIANPKILEVHSNGLVGSNNQPHGYPYSTYTSLRPMPQNMYSRGPVPANVTSSDGVQAVGPTWGHVNARAFRPNAVGTGGSFPIGAAPGSQDRVFRMCDARAVVHPQQKGVTTFQTLGNREAVYMIGPKPTTVMNEAGGLEHPVVVSRASFAKPACGSPEVVVQPGPSGTRRQWVDKHSATITTNEAEIKCPPTGSSVMSSSSLSSATRCPSESSTTERRPDKRQKSSVGVVCMSPVSDCEVEAAASTTSADGGNSCQDAGNSKFMGDDSSSRELVSSSTATNDAFGNVADSSTSTIERKSTKKSASKPKPGVNILGKIAALGTEPDRQQFLEELFAFMEYRGTPITTVPVICRQTVDLYRLYHHVKERSGMVEVSKGKRWRDVGSAMGIGGSTSAGFTLKRNYGRYLFPYECKFDRGDVDPTPLLAAMETPSRKDSRRRAAEREREREIEMEESQSSCSQLTATGQPPRNNGLTTTHGLSGYNIETTGNDGLITGSTMTSGMAGYQMGFTGSAGNQSSVDPTRSPVVNEQRSEFSTLQPLQVTNSYALHSMQCVRSSALANEGRGLSRSGSDYGRALAPAAVQVDSPMASKTDEDGYSSSMSKAGVQQAKGDRSEETSIGFPNILQSTMTSASDADIAGNASGTCELRSKAYLTSVPRIESAETRFRDPENKPSNGTSLQQMQGTSILRLGNASDSGALRTGQPSFGPASRGNCDGELQHSASFCQQYQNLVDGSCTSSSSAAELVSSVKQHQEHPFPASQVAKKLQFPKSEVGAGSLSVLRCEMQFPPESVEAKQPVLKKRRTLTHRDIGPIDPWGIMMSLRSGLISESTWALDVLSVLLHDDFTASAFSLSHVPGLLEVVVEHFRRCLIEIFGDDHFGDLETFVPRKEMSEMKYSPETISVMGMLEKHQEVGKFPTDNVDDKSDPNVMFESSALDWQMGHGDTTVHIITHMASENSGFHERQFFGKNLDVLKRKRSKSDKCVGKGLLADEESELHPSNSRKLKKTAEVVQSVDAKNDRGEISITGVLDSNVTANKRNMEDFEKEKSCVASPEKENVRQNSHVVEPSTAHCSEDRQDRIKDEPEKERSCGVSLEKETVHQNSFEVGLSTAFSSDGIQLFTCNHLDSLKQMYGEMGEEVVQPEETLIRCWEESKAEVARRCLCLSNVLRNLSLINGNEVEMSRHRGLVLVLSRLLLLHHYHRQHISKNVLSFVGSERHDAAKNRWWWWETLVNLRENSLVVLASIAGQMDLSVFPESICLPLLDGLLHWSVCRSAEAQDPFPGSSLCVGSLVLETLCKLCVTRANVDLLIATPPFARIVLLLSHLANLVGETQPQVTRELALGLMSRLVKADTSAARALALERSAFSFLLEFIEGTEHQARLVANTQGIEILQDFPETIGTSVDMLCRAADVLLCLAQIPANSCILSRFHHRLLQLVMSQILDCKVTAILAQVLGAAGPT